MATGLVHVKARCSHGKQLAPYTTWDLAASPLYRLLARRRLKQQPGNPHTGVDNTPSTNDSTSVL